MALNEELAYKRGVARPNNMWLNLVKMAGRLSVAPSLSWLLSIFISSFLYHLLVHKLLNTYLAREKRSCSAIVRKTVSYEWDISCDGRSILFQMLEQ